MNGKNEKGPLPVKRVLVGTKGDVAPKRESDAAVRLTAYNRIMVRPSRDRLEQLAGDLVNALSRSRAVVLLKDRNVVGQAVMQVLSDELRREEDREDNVRRRIAAMSDGPLPDTPEWEELFRRLIEEEHVRDGLDS